MTTDRIIGVFDLDTSTVSKITRDYLVAAEKNGEVINVSQELPKSFILNEKSKGGTVYISPLSPLTLIKRIENGESREIVRDKRKQNAG